MVLIPRVISSIDVPPEVYANVKTNLLDTVAGEKMVGLLTQIGQLAEIASDVFNNILKDATNVGQRIASLGQRIASLESITPAVQQTLASNPASSFYTAGKAVDFHYSERQTEQIFQPENRSDPIVRLRAQAAPPPQVHLLDSFAHSSCLAKYSDPSFFYMQWIKAEEEKLQKAMEEQQARKAKKKKKKKAAQPQFKQVEAVQTKVYSALGKEFEDAAKAQAQQQIQAQQQAVLAQQQELAQGGEEEEEENQPNTATANVPKMPQFNYNYNELPQLQYQPQQSAPAASAQSFAVADPYQAYAQPPLVGGDYNQAHQAYIPAVAPPVQPFQGMPTMPSPALARPTSFAPAPAVPAAPVFSIPSAPAAPEAPLAPEAPSAPDAPSTPTRASAAAPVGAPSGTPSDFASMIAARAAQGLKKVEVQQAEPTGRSGLLYQIRGGVQLRKVEAAKKDEKQPAGPAGMASIRAILARRAAIEQEDDEEDDEWGGK